MKFCARCRRPLNGEPIVVGGLGYGPTCAGKVGDLLTAKPEAKPGKRRRRANDKQPPLFTETT